MHQPLYYIFLVFFHFNLIHRSEVEAFSSRPLYSGRTFQYQPVNEFDENNVNNVPLVSSNSLPELLNKEDNTNFLYGKPDMLFMGQDSTSLEQNRFVDETSVPTNISSSEVPLESTFLEESITIIPPQNQAEKNFHHIKRYFVFGDNSSLKVHEQLPQARHSRFSYRPINKKKNYVYEFAPPVYAKTDQYQIGPVARQYEPVEENDGSSFNKQQNPFSSLPHFQENQSIIPNVPVMEQQSQRFPPTNPSYTINESNFQGPSQFGHSNLPKEQPLQGKPDNFLHGSSLSINLNAADQSGFQTFSTPSKNDHWGYPNGQGSPMQLNVPNLHFSFKDQHPYGQNTPSTRYPDFPPNSLTNHPDPSTNFPMQNSYPPPMKNIPQYSMENQFQSPMKSPPKPLMKNPPDSPMYNFPGSSNQDFLMPDNFNNYPQYSLNNGNMWQRPISSKTNLDLSFSSQFWGRNLKSKNLNETETSTEDTTVTNDKSGNARMFNPHETFKITQLKLNNLKPGLFTQPFDISGLNRESIYSMTEKPLIIQPGNSFGIHLKHNNGFPFDTLQKQSIAPQYFDVRFKHYQPYNGFNNNLMESNLAPSSMGFLNNPSITFPGSFDNQNVRLSLNSPNFFGSNREPMDLLDNLNPSIGPFGRHGENNAVTCWHPQLGLMQNGEERTVPNKCRAIVCDNGHLRFIGCHEALKDCNWSPSPLTNNKQFPFCCGLCTPSSDSYNSSIKKFYEIPYQPTALLRSEVAGFNALRKNNFNYNKW